MIFFRPPSRLSDPPRRLSLTFDRNVRTMRYTSTNVEAPQCFAKSSYLSTSNCEGFCGARQGKSINDFQNGIARPSGRFSSTALTVTRVPPPPPHFTRLPPWCKVFDLLLSADYGGSSWLSNFPCAFVSLHLSMLLYIFVTTKRDGVDRSVPLVRDHGHHWRNKGKKHRRTGGQR